jgi:uncharacterized protein
MGAAKVTLREQDKSTRVPGFDGVYGGIVIPAVKGPIDAPFLVTSDTQLLDKFTPDAKVEASHNLAFYSALEFLKKSKKLWVVRAHLTALYGGYSFIRDTGSASNAILGAGEADPTAHSFGVDDLFLLHGKNPGVWNNKLKVKVTTKKDSVDIKTGAPNVTIASGVATMTVAQAQNVNVGALVTYDTTKKAYVYSKTSSTVFVLKTLAGAAPANEVSPVLVDSINESLPEYAAQFKIQVYWDTDEVNAVETWNCSRVQGAKDGFGQSIYLEDVLVASEYIGAVDNVALSDLAIPREATSIVTFGAGTDGGTVTDTEMGIAADMLANKTAYPLLVFMDGAWATATYHVKLQTIAEARQDCVAICSIPYADENNSAYISAITTYRNTTLNMNSSYATLNTPHVQIADDYNNRKLYIGPDGFIAGAISETGANFELWYPAAGPRRGKVVALDLKRRYSEGELDSLADLGVNPIRWKAGRGMHIWAHKTQSTRPTALDRLNVRLLLIYIEPPIMEFLEDFLFELNDDATRSLVKAGIDEYMLDIQSRRGVYDFRTVCDDTNNSSVDIDNYKMNVWLFVKPIKGVEFIPFTVVITTTGASFTTVAESL